MKWFLFQTLQLLQPRPTSTVARMPTGGVPDQWRISSLINVDRDITHCVCLLHSKDQRSLLPSRDIAISHTGTFLLVPGSAVLVPAVGSKIQKIQI
jgi:hypothetical protein